MTESELIDPSGDFRPGKLTTQSDPHSDGRCVIRGMTFYNMVPGLHFKESYVRHGRDMIIFPYSWALTLS